MNFRLLMPLMVAGMMLAASPVMAAPANGGRANSTSVSSGSKSKKVSTDSLMERGEQGLSNRPLVLLFALSALALIPFVLMMVTCFVKIAVVLSIVRTALGTQQIPPTPIITGLSIILTIYIMAPVGLEMQRASTDVWDRKGGEIMSVKTVEKFLDAADRAKEPLRDWLLRQGHDKDRQMFYSLARMMREGKDREDLTPRDFIIVVPSFVISELKSAFEIGFILFVPFVVIDMVVANILLALGMQMLSPVVISLPFKLLLFVLVDGWYLVTKGLVLGYLNK